MTKDDLEKTEQKFNEETREEYSKSLNRKAAKLSEEELKRHALRFLDRYVVGTLATCAENIPRSTPIRYRNDGFTVYILTEGGGKVHNIEQNPNVSFSIFGNYTGIQSVRGLQLWGTAELFYPKDKEKYDAAFELMKLSEREDLIKAGVEQVQPGMTIIKINPSRVRYLSFPEGILNEELTLG